MDCIAKATLEQRSGTARCMKLGMYRQYMYLKNDASHLCVFSLLVTLMWYPTIHNVALYRLVEIASQVHPSSLALRPKCLGKAHCAPPPVLLLAEAYKEP